MPPCSRSTRVAAACDQDAPPAPPAVRPGAASAVAARRQRCSRWCLLSWLNPPPGSAAASPDRRAGGSSANRGRAALADSQLTVDPVPASADSAAAPAFGPDACERLNGMLEEARRWCRRPARATARLKIAGATRREADRRDGTQAALDPPARCGRVRRRAVTTALQTARCGLRQRRVPRCRLARRASCGAGVRLPDPRRPVGLRLRQLRGRRRSQGAGLDASAGALSETRSCAIA